METNKYAWKAAMLAERGRLKRALEIAEQGLAQAATDLRSASKAEWAPLRDFLDLNACLGALLMKHGAHAEAIPYLEVALNTSIPSRYEMDLFDPTRRWVGDALAQCRRRMDL